MIQHLIRHISWHLTRQPSNPKRHLLPQAQWLATRLRVPILALLGALFLQGALLLTVSETKPFAALASQIFGLERTGNALAAPLADDDEHILRYGIIVSRPVESIGSWVISDTTYTVTGTTQLEGDLVIGACVEVKSTEDAPTLAMKIIEQEPSKCDGDEDDDEDDEDDDDSGGHQTEYILRYGILNSRPEEKIGTWVISGTAYNVNDHTLIAGVMTVGECVEVKVEENEPTVALKLTEKSASKCRIADDNNERREWEGIIESLPPLLLGGLLQGEWIISIGENRKITFTTNLETDFDPTPDLLGNYAVGYWVEVKVKRQQDGSLLAERVRVDDYEVGQIVVRLESAAYSATLASEYGLILHSTLLNQANIYLFTTVNEDEHRLVGQIAQEDGVIWAEVNYVNSVPEDDGYKTWGWGGHDEPDAYFNQSAYQQVGLGNAARAYQGEGVVVAVLDTGIYTPHEQFIGKVQLPSLDVISDDSDPSEVGPGLAWGHGTHVAGVIAAMAPEAKILPVRVLDANGRGNTFLLAYAIEWAAAQPGVKVINLSLGTEFDSKILRFVIKNVVEQGIIVVAAAGNDGTSQVQYPAGYESVIGVTAVDGSSHKATFANYGAGWVDMAAPGVGIMSTMITADGPGYATWSGTSMSTAFVSGAAALVAEKWEVSTTQEGGMLDQLINTGLVLDLLNPLFAGQIGRLLDVSAALEVQSSLLFLPQTEK